MNSRLMREARAVRGTLMATIGLSLLNGILLIIQAALLASVINASFLNGTPLDLLLPTILWLLVVIVARGVTIWGSTTAAGYTAAAVKASLRKRVFAHVLALGPSFTQGERSGELTNTLTEGIEALDAYFSQYLPQLVIALLVPLAILILVFPLDLLTALVLLFTAPLIPLFMALIGMAAGAMARRQFGVLSQVSAHFLDVMQGLTTLKLLNRSKKQIEIIERITGQFRDATMDVLRIAFLSALALELLATLSVALVAVEIGIRLLARGIAFEEALFLLILAPEFYQPLRALGARFHAGTEGKAAAERIYAVLDTPGPAAIESPIETPPARMDIRLQAVDFAYGEGENARHALHAVDLHMQPGERVALVGPSGSGKSTIASLLLRFVEPTGGLITVDGQALNRIPPDLWREQVAWVPQQPYLFNISVAENIRLARPGATMDEVERAARDAMAHDFITRLPQGYDTIAGERGARLSGGQAQRLAVARAFLKDAPLLILDEATANLDPESEMAIEAALSRLLVGRTSLMIAHRLNTVVQADRIVVLQAGRVVEQGTHDALMASNGLYSRLVSAYTTAL